MTEHPPHVLHATSGGSVGSCIIEGASWTDPWGAKDGDDTRFDVQACP